MLVFAREKLVFLAMPKTGTTALESVLEPMAAMVMRKTSGLKHTPAYQYQRFLKPYFDKTGLENLETVCVLRHPIDWLGSWYRYRARPEKDGMFNSTKDMTFDAFVAEYAADEPADWARIGRPPRFIRDNNSYVSVDHLFQYEQMELLLGFLEDRLRTPIVLRQHNVSPRNDMTLSAATATKLEIKHPQMFEDWADSKR